MKPLNLYIETTFQCLKYRLIKQYREVPSVYSSHSPIKKERTMKKILYAAFLLAFLAGTAACSSDSTASGKQAPPAETPDSGDDGTTPDFDGTIQDYDGEKADDAALDVVGADEDLYWEANGFTTVVTVEYDGASARVTTPDNKVLYDCQGGYVTVDMLTNSVKNVELVVKGKSDDGGLKIYGDKKFKLTLSGVELTSTQGPAINDQCKKRVFVHLAEGTTNRLTDAETYSDDPYYLDGSSPADEDRKGCFFSEGNLIFSGTGVLVAEGRQKHALVTDGYFFMRPGVTVALTGAAKNGLHVKGDSGDGIGVKIEGGLLYINAASTAGKCIKTDLDVDIDGGRLLLNTSGGSEYDADENDTSSAAAIKADGDVRITGGEITIKSTGSGGKGINADGALTIDGGTVSVVTTGGKYIYDAARDLTSSPKGIKADGDIIINGGDIDVVVSGVSDGSEGIESKSTITINDGTVYSYAYDDAMNAATDITVNGGRVFCYAVNNDGIDSNGTITVTGGVIIASGSSRPEEGFDCDNNTFKITGGILIGTGGATSSPTSNVCTQRSVIYNGISATKGTLLCIRDSAGTPVLVYELPRTMSGMCLLFSAPGLTSGTYTVLTGGSVSGGSAWNGWHDGGSWSGGTQLGTFTATGMVTTVGSSGGGPGGGGRP